MNKYYELHITLFGVEASVKHEVQAMPGRWIFSCIDGDIDLGEGTKCYATKQYNIKMVESEVIAILTTAANYLKARKIIVLREKIEVVIYDKRMQ